MIKIIEFAQESHLSPAQWIGLTSEGKGVYIRYRWNKLTVRVGDNPVSGNVVYEKNHNNHNLTTNELIEILSKSDSININKKYNVSLQNMSEKLKYIRNKM